MVLVIVVGGNSGGVGDYRGGFSGYSGVGDGGVVLVIVWWGW